MLTHRALTAGQSLRNRHHQPTPPRPPRKTPEACRIAVNPRPGTIVRSRSTGPAGGSLGRSAPRGVWLGFFGVVTLPCLIVGRCPAKAEVDGPTVWAIGAYRHGAGVGPLMRQAGALYAARGQHPRRNLTACPPALAAVPGVRRKRTQSVLPVPGSPCTHAWMGRMVSGAQPKHGASSVNWTSPWLGFPVCPPRAWGSTTIGECSGGPMH